MTDEVIKKIKETQAELNATYTKYHNWEQGTKIMINSFYGGLGNQYMYFFNPNLAECITKQGKNAILYAERHINDYFHNEWFDAKDVHEKMGITVSKPVVGQVTVYIDTDSCDKDTVIHCIDKDRTIEELYEFCNQYGSAGVTKSGHESNNCPIDVLNYVDGKGLYYAKVRRVIRHKVRKYRWRLLTESGKEVYVTTDHSLIVYRDGVKMECKPSKVLATDLVLVTDIPSNKKVNRLKHNFFKYESRFERVAGVKSEGLFKNEYVYDIEMDDDTHTFIANDILVHNSVYSQLDEIIATTDWGMYGEENWKITIRKNDGKETVTTFCGKKSKEYVEQYFNVHGDDVEYYKLERIPGEPKDFAIKLDDVLLSDYFTKIFEEYAKGLNADNYLNFELESYSDAGIWLSKKKYMQNIRWVDSMPRTDIYDNFSKIKSKGVELIQASSPNFARKKLTYLVRWIFQHNDFTLKQIANELKKIKDEMYATNIDDLCWNKKATGYMKWVVDDTRELVMKKGTPATTKGIAYYNFLLERPNNQKYKTKHSRLNEGQKCKYYYTLDKNCEIFAYEPGMHPEFAPKIDIPTMFEKTILNPINRIIVAVGFPELQKDLVVLNCSTGLF